MRYTNLGSTNIKISVVGLGTMAIGGFLSGGADDKQSIKAIKASIDSGVTLIDTAPIYGKGRSENIVGKAIKGQRDKVILATKCGVVWGTDKGKYMMDYAPGDPIYSYLGPEMIKKEIEDSLKRLDTDYIDLYQPHQPDPTTPVEDTMEALLDLKKEGKIRAIGICNQKVDILSKYRKAGQIDSIQDEYNILQRDLEEESIPWARENNITVLTYCTLAKGMLTGKMGPDAVFNGDDIRNNHKRFPMFARQNMIKTNSYMEKYLKPIAEKYGITLAQLATAFVTSQDNLVALVGARNDKQAVMNAKAGDILLIPEEVDGIKKAFSKLVYQV